MSNSDANVTPKDVAIPRVCPPPGGECPPCDPPKGTIRGRVDIVPPSKPHYPYSGSHIHLYIMHQAPYPNCRCGWSKYDVLDGDQLPNDIAPMSSL